MCPIKLSKHTSVINQLDWRSFSTKLVFLSALQQIKQIEKALDAIRDVTCVKFVSFNPKKHRDYITIVGNYSDCFASGPAGARASRQPPALQRRDGLLQTLHHCSCTPWDFFTHNRPRTEMNTLGSSGRELRNQTGSTSISSAPTF